MDTPILDRLQRAVRAAEERHAREVLEAVCRQVGVGVGAVQSRERTAETARRREVVVWVLCSQLKWPQAKAAQATGRTVRQIKRILKKERVMSPFGGT